MRSLGSEFPATMLEMNPANAGECRNAIGLVVPKKSTKEDCHVEVAEAVCV